MVSVPQWFTKLGLMIGRQQALTTDAERQAFFFTPSSVDRQTKLEPTPMSTQRTMPQATDSVDLWNSSQGWVFCVFFNLH
jgi:hypothetical protein